MNTTIPAVQTPRPHSMPYGAIPLAVYGSVPGLSGSVINTWYDIKGKFVIATITNHNSTSSVLRFTGGVFEFASNRGWFTAVELISRVGTHRESDLACWAAFMRSEYDGPAAYGWDVEKDNTFWKDILNDIKQCEVSAGVMLE